MDALAHSDKHPTYVPSSAAVADLFRDVAGFWGDISTVTQLLQCDNLLLLKLHIFQQGGLVSASSPEEWQHMKKITDRSCAVSEPSLAEIPVHWHACTSAHKLIHPVHDGFAISRLCLLLSKSRQLLLV